MLLPPAHDESHLCVVMTYCSHRCQWLQVFRIACTCDLHKKRSRITPTPRCMGLAALGCGDGSFRPRCKRRGSPNHSSTRGTTPPTCANTQHPGRTGRKKKGNHRSRQPRRQWASALQGAGVEGQHRAIQLHDVSIPSSSDHHSVAYI